MHKTFCKVILHSVNYFFNFLIKCYPSTYKMYKNTQFWRNLAPSEDSNRPVAFQATGNKFAPKSHAERLLLVRKGKRNHWCPSWAKHIQLRNHRAAGEVLQRIGELRKALGENKRSEGPPKIDRTPVASPSQRSLKATCFSSVPQQGSLCPIKNVENVICWREVEYICLEG